MTDRPPSLHVLLANALRDSSNLARQEFALFRAEVGENIQRIVGGVVFLIVAAVFAMASLIWLTQALVDWLATIVHSRALAALIVGGGLALIAALMAIMGKNRISAASLAPSRTVQSVQRDAEVLTERVSG